MQFNIFNVFVNHLIKKLILTYESSRGYLEI